MLHTVLVLKCSKFSVYDITARMAWRVLAALLVMNTQWVYFEEIVSHLAGGARRRRVSGLLW